MARIIVSYYKMQEMSIGARMYYYESVIEELKRQGNDVMVLNSAFMCTYDSNDIENEALNALVLRKTKEFRPDLIITFNNRIPRVILDNTDVPVVMWDGDSPLYLCDTDYMKKNLDRYKIFSISEEWYKDYLEMGVRPENYVFMPNATAIVPKDVPQTMNISYVGTRIWTDLSVPRGMQKYYHLAASKNVILENLNSGNGDNNYYLNKYFAEQVKLYGWDERKIYPLLEKRWLTLANVLDMGLTICGSYSRWEGVYETMPQILAMYNPRRVWTLQENIDFYNESKISLSPIHPQADGKAFPWRAFDVMGSNACLVIEKSSDFASLVKGKVDIPMFDSPYEVRDICKKLLSDEPYRKEIVAQSQEWVNENARWTDRFRTAEQALGMKLLGDDKEAEITDLIDVNGVIEDNKESVTVRMVKNQVQVKGNKKGFGKIKSDGLFTKLAKAMENPENPVKMMKWSLIAAFLCGVFAMFIDTGIIKTDIIDKKMLGIPAFVFLCVGFALFLVIFGKLCHKAFSFLTEKKEAEE